MKRLFVLVICYSLFFNGCAAKIDNKSMPDGVYATLSNLPFNVSFNGNWIVGSNEKEYLFMNRDSIANFRFYTREYTLNELDVDEMPAPVIEKNNGALKIYEFSNDSDERAYNWRYYINIEDKYYKSSLLISRIIPEDSDLITLSKDLIKNIELDNSDSASEDDKYLYVPLGDIPFAIQMNWNWYFYETDTQYVLWTGPDYPGSDGTLPGWPEFENESRIKLIFDKEATNDPVPDNANALSGLRDGTVVSCYKDLASETCLIKLSDSKEFFKVTIENDGLSEEKMSEAYSTLTRILKD